MSYMHPTDRALQDLFAHIDTIYTDIDGTLLSPGGHALTDDKGTPSLELAQTLIDLKNANIQVIPTTGRTRVQLNEICKLLNFDTMIGELGGIVTYGSGDGKKTNYLTGDLLVPEGKTANQAIYDSGLIDQMKNRYGEQVIFPLPVTGPDSREMSTLMLSNISREEGLDVVSRFGLPLNIIDNGIIDLTSYGIPASAQFHKYLLIPRAVNKANGIRYDQKYRGLNPQHALAIGDSVADVQMAEAVGAFAMVSNALDDPRVIESLNNVQIPVCIADKRTSEGFCQVARAILDARN